MLDKLKCDVFFHCYHAVCSSFRQ